MARRTSNTKRKPVKKAKKRSPAVDPARRMLLRQISIGVLLAVVLGGLIWGVWQVTRLPVVTISEVTARGGVTIAPQTVVAVAEAELIGSYYRLIPKRFTYLYPKQRIIAAIEQIPRLESVTIERVERTSLRVRFTEYVPEALWCQAEQCVFIDAAGYAFAEAPVLSGTSFVRYQAGTAMPEVGVVGVPPSVFRRTQQFSAVLSEALNLRPQRIWFDDRDITYLLGGGGEIRVARTDDVAALERNLTTLMASEEFAHLEPGNFEYIDLRYGNKVFVQEVIEEVATSTEDIAEE